MVQYICNGRKITLGFSSEYGPLKYVVNKYALKIEGKKIDGSNVVFPASIRQAIHFIIAECGSDIIERCYEPEVIFSNKK